MLIYMRIKLCWSGVAVSNKTSCASSCAFESEMHIAAVFLLQSWKLLTPLGSRRDPSAEVGAAGHLISARWCFIARLPFKPGHAG